MTARTSSDTTTLTLPSDREILITRVFDAPRALVFETMNRPEHMKRWWGPRGYELTVCEIDLRPGGAYRFVQRTADGQEFAFRGEYREVVPPERVVTTFEFEGMPGHISLVTVILDEQDGKTLMTETMLFDTADDRDGMIQSGMESGMRESLDQLAELLARLA
jgi:uncharacterized protein YndB with AHSA1/START domain